MLDADRKNVRRSDIDQAATYQSPADGGKADPVEHALFDLTTLLYPETGDSERRDWAANEAPSFRHRLTSLFERQVIQVVLSAQAGALMRRKQDGPA